MSLDTASTYPISKVDLPNPSSSTLMNADGYEHDLLHVLTNNVIEDIQDFVGITSSADTSSLDYLIKSSVDPGHTHTSASLPTSFLSSIVTDSGTATISSNSVNILGGEGIDTSGSGSTLTIAGEDATTSNKGIASFDTNDFTVSSGAVSVKDSGIDHDATTNFVADEHIDWTGDGTGTIHINNLPVGNAGEQLTVNEGETALEFSLASRYLPCRKSSVGTISAGAPVYIDGYNVAGWVEVEEADADDASKMPAIGIAYDDITNSSTDRVLLFGNATGIVDTSSWSVGDKIYVDTTAGQLTNVKPTGATDLVQKIGIVGRSHAVSGEVIIFGAGRSNDIPNYMDDAVFRIADDADATKIVMFQASGITTGTTRTFTFPDASGTFVLESRTLTAGTGLTGGGDLSANRTFDIDLNELTTETSIAAGDFIAMVDITDSGSGKITFANFESTIDHGALAGLGDDDHSQYTLLAGRSGGQTLIGGTGSGDDLTLETTSDVTKGSYILSDLTSDGIVTAASGVLATITDSSTNWDTAYTHSQDNSQAHSDYLINNGNDTTSGTITAAGLTIDNGGEARFYDTGSSNYVGFEAPALSGDQIWILPAADSSGSQYLQSDGSGNLSWTTPAGSGDVVGPASATDNAVARFDTTSGKLLQNSGVIVDDSDNITGVTSIDIATGGLQINSVAVSSTAAELNLNDGATAGTSVASKTLALGASKNTDILVIDNAINFNAPQGFLVNGVITTSVATNDLTVEIKTIGGGDPSASDPVYVRIGDSVRSITSALSITLTDGTDYFNSGSPELATEEVDYFVYLGWNAGNTAVRLGFARVPNGITYSDFSGTSTDENYLATSGTLDASDEVENVGRFNAILSASAAHNWSLPGTSIVINRPTFETRQLEYNPTLVGFSSAPTNSTYVYTIVGDYINIDFAQGTDGTSNSTSFTATTPYASANITNNQTIAPIIVRNNSSTGTNPGRMVLLANASTFTFAINYGGSAWTASGGKRCLTSFTYPI
jgi:hypothetical protein